MSYEVDINEKVKETFRLANINYDNSKWLPIDLVKKACEINLKDSFKPIYSQYLWFCLDGVRVRRKLASGKVLIPQVIFNPVYLENKDKIVSLIKRAMKKLPQSQRINFARLVGRSPQSIDSWKSRRAKVPITAVLKACQILRLDPWKTIDGERLYTSGKSAKNSIIFKNRETNEIREIITWIKAEGYLRISSTEVGLVQNKEGKDSLQDVINKIIKSFHISQSNIHIGIRSDKPNAIDVVISSAPLRQILCLKYGISIGFKSYSINYSNEINNAKSREEKLKLLSKIFESEGSFGFRRFNLPDFHIVSASLEAIKNVNSLLKNLGYEPFGPTPHHSAFKTGIGNIEGSVKFCYDILPYFKHKEKIEYILFGNNDTTHGFLSEEYLTRLNKRYKASKHWLLISWIHGIISRRILETNRGLTFKNIEEVLNGRKI